jgi:hypothetical protein
MDTLYAINDAVTALASQFNVRSQFAGGADDDYDDMLNGATLAVARIFWPDVPGGQ